VTQHTVNTKLQFPATKEQTAV